MPLRKPRFDRIGRTQQVAGGVSGAASARSQDGSAVGAVAAELAAAAPAGAVTSSGRI